LRRLFTVEDQRRSRADVEEAMESARMSMPGMEASEARPVIDDRVERRPALRALAGGGANDELASAVDREMIEATSSALGLFAAKWKVDLLYLLAAGVRRHKHLHDHLVVSKKVLSDALKALERDGLVRRRVYAENPVRVEYSLTPLGRSLTVPLFALCEWAGEHFERVLGSRREYDLRAEGRIEAGDGAPRFTAAFQVRQHGVAG
jgi:DNA-binding HxlR family transcriptional regulator